MITAMRITTMPAMMRQTITIRQNRRLELMKRRMRRKHQEPKAFMSLPGLKLTMDRSWRSRI